MNAFVRKTKLYKVRTVLHYCRESWKNSAKIIEYAESGKRLAIYFDLIYWFVKYGNDFNDYCTFEFWNKTNEQRKSYISLRRNDVLRISFSTPDVFTTFLDKAAFNKKFNKYIHRAWLDTREHNWNEIKEFLDNNTNVIAKPLDDFGGHGIFSLNINSESFNNNLSKLKTSIDRGNKFILEEIIENRSDIKIFAPASLNTLRFVTVIDKNNNFHLIAALLRFGSGTGLTDNYHAGGMACPINIEQGCLTKTAFGMDCKKYNEHPFSKIKFEGYKLEDFSDCIKIIKEIAYVEPNARYVGWDLALTSNGIELLEGNIPPGEDITQIATGRGMWYDMLEWK